ncbi:hypothetical protein TeGR_g2533 [Tetraparma gracilis]|uniref:EF-hand domain-containing protein n=1 Tax=Tetraparma gracilis TaxID=2962635 RepID=A0ABQ6MJ27_9STRA|nr:hypothetical protein TeGR_g2533 [Tetraparma gracilis]
MLTERLGPGQLFAEGSVLFNRSHSASVIADRSSPSPSSLLAVSGPVFRSRVLASSSMRALFEELGPVAGADGERAVTMDDFVASIGASEAEPPACGPGSAEADGCDGAAAAAKTAANSLRMSNTFKIFRQGRVGLGTHPVLGEVVLTSNGSPDGAAVPAVHSNITFPEFCLFHQVMSRPDPEVDIAFALMDTKRKGYITKADFEL